MQNRPARLFVVSEDVLVTQWFRQFVQTSEEVELVGVSSELEEAFSQTSNLGADILIIDNVSEPSKAMEKIRDVATKVIFLTVSRDPEWMRAGLMAGVADFLSKPLDSDEVSKVIQRSLKFHQDL
jgi:DNA-binding NarL/FixJ family response regulator